MREDRLQRIQSLQFTDRSAAESLLLNFLREVYSSHVISAELRPLTVSLNSFNGYLTLASGRRLFFKSHIESGSVIDEYYNSALLADAGYPIIHPVFASTKPGTQLLIYELVEDSSVFDLAWSIEQGDGNSLDALTTVQADTDALICQIYLATLQASSAGEDAAAPIHQLFFHRLASGRMAHFYGDFEQADPGSSQSIQLPDGVSSIRDVMHARWQINGQTYDETLHEVIRRAKVLLKPGQSGPVIVGHGDAHNGNIFYRVAAGSESPSLVYFDPAFAGRHHPLLDLAKPLFHNVFAMWMYFPQHFAHRIDIRLNKQRNLFRVNYIYPLPAVRMMFFESKVTRVLMPVLEVLAREKLLRPDWRAYMKAALFCCPFLTLNLADSTRFTPEISLLGLVMSMEMGSESRGQRSVIDEALDEARHLLGL